MDAIRNPTPLGLAVSLALLVIPLAWPVTLYMWLRYLTGHRGRTPPKEEVPIDWGPGLDRVHASVPIADPLPTLVDERGSPTTMTILPPVQTLAVATTICPECGGEVVAEARFCPHCRYEFAPTDPRLASTVEPPNDDPAPEPTPLIAEHPPNNAERPIFGPLPDDMSTALSAITASRQSRPITWVALSLAAVLVAALGGFVVGSSALGGRPTFAPVQPTQGHVVFGALRGPALCTVTDEVASYALGKVIYWSAAYTHPVSPGSSVEVRLYVNDVLLVTQPIDPTPNDTCNESTISDQKGRAGQYRIDYLAGTEVLATGAVQVHQ
jgi:hypothetical protein